jgi:hypothetical protein
MKLEPTWRNFRVNDEAISKILDIFLVSEKLMNNVLCSNIVYPQVVSQITLHCFQASGMRESHLDTFQVQSFVWLREEDYQALIKESWKPLSSSDPSPFMCQFADNILCQIDLQELGKIL